MWSLQDSDEFDLTVNIFGPAEPWLVFKGPSSFEVFAENNVAGAEAKSPIHMTKKLSNVLEINEYLDIHKKKRFVFNV